MRVRANTCIIIVLSCNFWTKDTWFALAKLAFSCVWLVVHSTYEPRTNALYIRASEE